MVNAVTLYCAVTPARNAQPSPVGTRHAVSVFPALSVSPAVSASPAWVPSGRVVERPRRLSAAEQFALMVLDGSREHFGITARRFNSFTLLVTSYNAAEERICILYLSDGGSVDIGATRDTESAQRAVTVAHLIANDQPDLAGSIADEYPAIVAAIRVEMIGAQPSDFSLTPVGGFYL